MNPEPRLLILSPAFHDYDVAFSRAFEFLGFRTHTHLYDRWRTTGEKAWNKVRFELPERLGADTTAAREAHANARVLEAVRSVRPDVVLVIKGDVLHDDVWQELRARNVPTVLWLYDELRRTRWKDDRLRMVPQVASYSVHDVESLRAAGVDATHVPLGFDHLSGFPTRGRGGEVTFIGARYPQRERILRGLHSAGVPVRAFGRDWSHDVRDRLRTWGGTRPDLPSGRDLSRTAAYTTMEQSLATLNIHGDQDGFTMRTFEACGVGAVQLCDRADVSDFYEPDREILTFASADEAREKIARISTDRNRADRLRENARRRTLAENTLVHRARAVSRLW